MCHALLLPLLTAMLGDQYPLLLPPLLLLLLLLRETHCLLLRPHYGALSPPSWRPSARLFYRTCTYETEAEFSYRTQYLVQYGPTCTKKLGLQESSASVRHREGGARTSLVQHRLRSAHRRPQT